MQKVTLKMLAAKLQLSRSTVSKALNDSYEISDETKERVRLMANKMQFVPNPYASSLRKKTSKTIAAVVPEVADSFFAQAINGIESAAQEKGYHVLIYLTHDNFLKEKEIIKDIQNGRIDGVLVSLSAETTNYAHLKELCEKGIPLIFFDRVCNIIATAKITTNDYESGYKATQHLINCGCKKVAFLALAKNLLITEQRLLGYYKALLDYNIPSFKADLLYCNETAAINYSNVKKMLSGKFRPDGIISSVEKLATVVYDVCRELNLAIPGNIKVICFSNLQTAHLLNPALTTITQPAYDMGQTAATALFRILKKNVPDVQNEGKVLPSSLIIRHSTMPPGTTFTTEVI